MRSITKLTLVFAALVSNFVVAEESYNHFPSLPSNDTQTAICNLNTYNLKLQEIISKKRISPEDMVKIHELTYTLENAVARLQTTLEVTAVELEKVHKASERMDSKVVKHSGDSYIQQLETLLNPASCKK